MIEYYLDEQVSVYAKTGTGAGGLPTYSSTAQTQRIKRFERTMHQLENNKTVRRVITAMFCRKDKATGNSVIPIDAKIKDRSNVYFRVESIEPAMGIFEKEFWVLNTEKIPS